MRQRLLATSLVLTAWLWVTPLAQAEEHLDSVHLLRTHTEQLLDEFIGTAEQQAVESLEVQRPRAGSCQISGEGFLWTQDDLDKKTVSKTNKGRLWKQKQELFAASEPSGEGRHYFVQGYFGNIKPFETSPLLIWKHVHQTISLQDNEAHIGVQTSAETYTKQAGTVQEVSILLADWISATGFDARVVEGHRDGSYHTWVSILDGTTTYIIDVEESPQDRISLSTKTERYQARRGYNAEFLWIYSAEGWHQISRFIETNEAPATSSNQSLNSQYRVTNDTPIMLSPLATSRNVGVLKRGERVQIIHSEGDWHQVVYRGEHTGYVPRGSTQRVL